LEIRWKAANVWFMHVVHITGPKKYLGNINHRVDVD